MKKTVLLTSLVLTISIIFSCSIQAEPVIADAVNGKTVKLGGEAFGIKMFSDGVMVVEVENTLPGTDTPSPAVTAGIQVNDIIKKVNNISIYSNEEFTKIIKEYNGTPLNLLIERNNMYFKTSLKPEYDTQGILRAGIWIKDSAAGIGTITFYDTENSTFGALGHGICEASTGRLIPISYGEIAQAKINDITISENGKVGSLNGYFDGEPLGEVYCNSDCGIFGEFVSEPNNETVMIAGKDEVNIGKAEIYCTLNDNIKKAYEIKIKRLTHHGQNTMIIEITDPELISHTGGIVQGMSGSPIVQNGKLVGAITHVLVNNVKCGYGIYIEDMIEKIA